MSLACQRLRVLDCTTHDMLCKEVYITKSNATTIAAVAKTSDLNICTYEEADTRIIIHALNAVEKGIIIIWTVDSNITTILLD